PIGAVSPEAMGSSGHRPQQKRSSVPVLIRWIGADVADSPTNLTASALERTCSRLLQRRRLSKRATYGNGPAISAVVSGRSGRFFVRALPSRSGRVFDSAV